MAHIDPQETIPQKSAPLNVLLIEDDPLDAELCLRLLTKRHPDIHIDVVSTAREFTDRLRSEKYDIVLSDFGLGTWTGPDALEVLRKETQDIPFILVTGSLGEEKAVECIKHGMDDFILKDRLERLPVAISRALQEKALRGEYRRAEDAIRESEAKFRALADALPAAIFIEERGLFRYVNRAAEDLTGYGRDELFAMNFSQIVHLDSRDAFKELEAKRNEGDAPATYRFEIMIQPKGHEPRWLDVAAGTFTNDGAPATLTAAFDVTERKRADREIQYDVPTGLPNRNHLAAVFDTEVSRSSRTGHTFSVLLVALDGITRILQRYGHLAAGEAMVRVARTTRLHCRNLDTVARVGADQIAVVLPETPPEGAMILGRRIADRLRNKDQEVSISCRCAAASHPADGNTLDDAIRAAELQLKVVLQK